MPNDETEDATPDNRRRFLQGRGAELATDFEIDVSAYHVAGHIHSVFTLMRSMVERGPLGDANLSLTAFIALWSIWVNGDMEGKEIASEIGIARSSFSELAHRLERRGLLSRHADPNDGRVVLFRVTEEGRRTVENVWPRMNAEVSAMTSELSADEQTKLVDHLALVADQLESMIED